LIDYSVSPVMKNKIIIAILIVVVVAYNIKSITENPMQNHNNHNYDNANDNDDNKINVPEVKERRNRCLARENRLRLNRPWNGK